MPLSRDLEIRIVKTSKVRIVGSFFCTGTYLEVQKFRSPDDFTEELGSHDYIFSNLLNMFEFSAFFPLTVFWYGSYKM